MTEKTITLLVKRVVVILFLLFLSANSIYALSYEEEREIARDFITYLDSRDLIVYDQDIIWPVRMIMDRLVDHIDGPIYPFKIYIVKDRSVNAFAIPDGHIFINVGTLMFVKDTDELSAIIGHEIGHSQMRHISQYFETQKKISTATIVGVIAGTILSAKNPEIGTAMVYSSIGGGENIKLAYSRRNEYEADEFGRNLMKSSDFDPSAMTRFLVRMQAFTGGINAPEYLLTHPYTENRIASNAAESGDPNPDNTYWTLYANVVGLMLSGKEASDRAQSMPEPYKSLVLGILRTREGKYEEALAVLENVDLPQAYEYKGLNLYMLGKKDMSYPLLKNYGKSAQTRIALAEIMEEKGEIEQAIQVLFPYQKKNVQVDYRLGILYEKSSKSGPSHVSFARYFFKTGKYKASLHHIDAALEVEQDLDKDTVEEMKETKKYINKMLRS